LFQRGDRVLRSKLAQWSATVALGTVLAACGGNAVSAETYAQEYCSAAQPFFEDLQKFLGEIFQAAGGGEAAGEAFGALGDSVAEFRDEVEGIGTPDVEGGEEFHDNLVSVLDDFGSALDEAQDQFEEGAPEEAASTLQDLQENVQQLDVQPPAELEQAFQEQEECQELQL
jgi:hypothetical protein